MAARSSPSDYASSSTDEKLVTLDLSDHGPSEIMRLGVQRRTVQAESSSFKGQLNNSKERKGKAIISGIRHFDELAGVKVVTPNNLEEEIFEMKGIYNNLQHTMRIRRSLNNRQAVVMDEGLATDTLCGCCYWKCQSKNMVKCQNGHEFCFECIRRRVEQIIYGGLRAHGYLSCTAIDGCKESIPLSEIRRALTNDTLQKYEDRRARDAVVEANIEGLVYCPFCSIPYEADKCVQVLDCPNPKCLKASCIKCKRLSHLPLSCEQVLKMSGTALCREVEERMTNAVIRKCNICQAELIKMDGTCNRVICRCGNAMCYICRQRIGSTEYSHFCHCNYFSGDPGRPCPRCNRCSFLEVLVEDKEALVAKEEALKNFVVMEPKLFDLKIGPPLRELRKQSPTEEQEQGHHIQRPQRFTPHATVPAERFNGLGDRLANMVAFFKRHRSVIFGLGLYFGGAFYFYHKKIRGKL